MLLACSTYGLEDESIWDFLAKPEGNRPLEDLEVGGRTILKRILEKEDGIVHTGFIWLRRVTSGRIL